MSVKNDVQLEYVSQNFALTVASTVQLMLWMMAGDGRSTGVKFRISGVLCIEASDGLPPRDTGAAGYIMSPADSGDTGLRDTEPSTSCSVGDGG
jgi:hypothetical protein